MKIVLTGGHLTPAYAFAEVAAAQGDSLLLIGSSKLDASKYQEIKRLGIAYKIINSIKYDRYNKLKSLITLPRIVLSIVRCIQILRSFKPDVIVTFGSFNAVPVAFAGKLLHIPYITHEQTASIGLANKLIAPGASSCAVSYQGSLSSFPKAKTMVIGNLLRQAIWQPSPVAPFTIPTRLPIIFITGGNQGSETIVKAILSIINTLTNKYQVVLQHGKINPFLDNQLTSKVIAKSWFNTDETAWLFHHAHIVISRGGANTTAELMVAGVPAIIIPLAGSADEEQTNNAKIFMEEGAGILIPQRKCSGTILLESLETIEAAYETYHAHARQLAQFQFQNAAMSLYQMAITAKQTV